MSAISISLLFLGLVVGQAASPSSKKPDDVVTLATKVGGKTFEEWDRLIRDEGTDWASKRKAIEAIKPEEAATLVRAIQSSGKTPSGVLSAAHLIFKMSSPALKAKAFPSLLKLLDDPSNDVRTMAALAIADCGEIGEPAMPRLEKLAKGKEKEFLNYASVALTGLRSDKVQRFILKNDPTVVQFHSLYPQAVFFITHFAAEKTTPHWNSKVGLFGRYELELQFDLKIDKKKWTATAEGPPKFYFTAVSSVELRSGRIDSLNYDSSSQRNFGLEKWKELVAAKGDLNVLGITPIKDKPFEGFDRYWKNE